MQHEQKVARSNQAALDRAAHRFLRNNHLSTEMVADIRKLYELVNAWLKRRREIDYVNMAAGITGDLDQVVPGGVKDNRHRAVTAIALRALELHHRSVTASTTPPTRRSRQRQPSPRRRLASRITS